MMLRQQHMMAARYHAQQSVHWAPDQTDDVVVDDAENGEDMHEMLYQDSDEHERILNDYYASRGDADVAQDDVVDTRSFIMDYPLAESGATEEPSFLGQSSMDAHYEFAKENALISTSSEDTSSAEALFEQGMQCFERGDISNAVLHFEASLQCTDGSICETWRMLGLCHAENDDDKRAIECYKSALECDPYDTASLLSLGTSYLNEMNPSRALHCLKGWVEHNPEFHDIKIAEVDDMYGDGSMMDEVVRLMLAVSSKSRENASVRAVLGVLYNVTADFDAAAREFREAMGGNVNDYNLWNKVS